MHALRLNGAGSRLGSTVGSTRVAVCDDRRHRRLVSRVEHPLGMKRMLALRYLLVATSRSLRWWTSCVRVSTPLNSVFARMDPPRPASPGRMARILRGYQGPRSRSNAAPSAMTGPSWPGGPTNWAPIGSPDSERPHGVETAGKPTKLQGIALRDSTIK